MSSAPFKNVAVVGASGNLGPHILHALLSTTRFNITVIARNSSTSVSALPPSVRVLKGDYSPTFLASALKDIDAVVLTLGPDAMEEQKRVIEAAAKAGVRRVVPSEFGSDSTNPVAVKAVPFYQHKVDFVNHIKSVAASYPSLTWTAFITGPFYDFCLKAGFYGFDLANKTAILYDEGKAKFDTTTLSTVGSAVANALSQPGKYANEYVYVSSFTTSQAEMLAALKTASGTDNWTVEHRSSEEYLQDGREKAAKGDMTGTLQLIFGTTFQAGNGADFSSLRKLSNKELGLEVEDVKKVTTEVYETGKHSVE